LQQLCQVTSDRWEWKRLCWIVAKGWTQLGGTRWQGDIRQMEMLRNIIKA